MGWGLAAMLTDRPLDGLGIVKNFKLGKISAYVTHSNLASIAFGRTTGISSTSNFGAWEFFAMGEFQFTERFGFDMGIQYVNGDDSSTLEATDAGGVVYNLDFDMLYTIFGGVRFNFDDNIALRGIYFYQDSDYSIDGVDVENAYTDSRSAFRVLVDVKQDLLKFTNLWFSYEQLEQGFVTPNGYSLILSGLDGRSLIGTSDHTTIGSLMRDDMSVWRLGARQRWNDKWTTFGYVADHSFDNLDANVLQWAVGVVYKLSPSVQFGLVYSHNDVDDALQTDPNFKDSSVLRFRTFVSF
jgi:opacity protein-like surface antigen